ncbi:hypothetical protein ACQ4PT_054070 [Festuca glaucescens]
MVGSAAAELERAERVVMRWDSTASASTGGGSGEDQMLFDGGGDRAEAERFLQAVDDLRRLAPPSPRHRQPPAPQLLGGRLQRRRAGGDGAARGRVPARALDARGGPGDRGAGRPHLLPLHGQRPDQLLRGDGRRQGLRPGAGERRRRRELPVLLRRPPQQLPLHDQHPRDRPLPRRRHLRPRRHRRPHGRRRLRPRVRPGLLLRPQAGRRLRAPPPRRREAHHRGGPAPRVGRRAAQDPQLDPRRPRHRPRRLRQRAPPLLPRLPRPPPLQSHHHPRSHHHNHRPIRPLHRDRQGRRAAALRLRRGHQHRPPLAREALQDHRPARRSLRSAARCLRHLRRLQGGGVDMRAGCRDQDASG